MGDDLANLFLADEGPLDTLGHVGVARQQQHVALADQLLGTRLIEDDAAVGEAVDRVRGACRDVGLDDAGDDVDRRPLRRHDEVDPDRAGLLGDARDALLDVARRDHHQVVELVDDDQDVGKPLEDTIGSRFGLRSPRSAALYPVMSRKPTSNKGRSDVPSPSRPN